MVIIMVVDDNEDIRSLLRLLLESEGYNLVEAGSGEECLMKFDAVRPDLILLDINMPGINGWDVCKQIKERMLNVHIPISMLSTRKTKEDIRRSMEYAHADAYIEKPFDKKELRNTVKKLLKIYTSF